MAKKNSLAVVEKDASALQQLTAEQRLELDALVLQLNSVQRGATLQTAYSIGKLVLDRVFGGDVSRFRQPTEGDVTWRALSEHPDLEVKHTALWYSVALHENYALLGEELASALSMGHHRLLAHVADAEARRGLAQRALSQELSVRALEQEVKDAKKPVEGQKKRGRKEIPEPLKRLGRAVKELKDLKVDDALDAGTRAKALANARAIGTKVAELIARLGGE